ncbi:MAG TPA: RtcB family protein [Polyangia bacterium]|jgi:tRNA-splicing ligase RtcB
MPNHKLQQQGPFTYEIVREGHDRAVPARVYADATLVEAIRRDRSLDQLLNVATLPGVRHCVYAMPDVHEGYGFPVGGVAATRARGGVISPGGVGYDINCGVRLLAADVQQGEVRDRLEALTHDLARSVPSGTGRGGHLSLDDEALDGVLTDGCHALVERGLAAAADLQAIEATGRLDGADAAAVSPRAKDRGRTQLGTLGSGNHFVEIGVVDEVFDDEAARTYGLAPGQLTLLIHTGSRGLGHQVCTDYVRTMDAVMARYEIRLPDRELACAPLESPEGQRYFRAMCAAGNFAWANRQLIAEHGRRVFTRALGVAGRLRLVYDVAHNLAKLEDHGGERLCVHRKGATRAFGPSSPETPPQYRAVGQPVIIPGSMGTASYVLRGTDEAMRLSFGSTCHGAGRAMSRGAARRATDGKDVRSDLSARGIVVRCASMAELAEEAPVAYKDVDRVVNVVDALNIAKKVARLRPLGVVKG